MADPPDQFTPIETNLPWSEVRRQLEDRIACGHELAGRETRSIAEMYRLRKQCVAWHKDVVAFLSIAIADREIIGPFKPSPVLNFLENVGSVQLSLNISLLNGPDTGDFCRRGFVYTQNARLGDLYEKLALRYDRIVCQPEEEETVMGQDIKKKKRKSVFGNWVIPIINVELSIPELLDRTRKLLVRFLVWLQRRLDRP